MSGRREGGERVLERESARAPPRSSGRGAGSGAAPVQHVSDMSRACPGHGRSAVPEERQQRDRLRALRRLDLAAEVREQARDGGAQGRNHGRRSLVRAHQRHVRRLERRGVDPSAAPKHAPAAPATRRQRPPARRARPTGGRLRGRGQTRRRGREAAAAQARPPPARRGQRYRSRPQRRSEARRRAAEAAAPRVAAPARLRPRAGRSRRRPTSRRRRRLRRRARGRASGRPPRRCSWPAARAAAAWRCQTERRPRPS